MGVQSRIHGVSKSKAKPTRYPIRRRYRGVLYEFVDKTDRELVQEYQRLSDAIIRARVMLRQIRSANPAIRAASAHFAVLTPDQSVLNDSKKLADEVCRLNLAFQDGVRILEKLSNSTIQPLEALRFHLTYSCTHKKRDLSSGWNKGAIGAGAAPKQETEVDLSDSDSD
jgi:hypothetical protein